MNEGLKYLINDLYEKYNPAKLPELNEAWYDSTLNHYKGDHRLLISDIMDTYNPEKAQALDENWFQEIENHYKIAPFAQAKAEVKEPTNEFKPREAENDSSFFAGLKRGAEIGAREMGSSIGYGLYDVAEKADNWLYQKMPDWYKKWSDNSRETSQNIKQAWAIDLAKNAPKAMGGAGEFIGQLIPQVAMIGASIATGNPMMASAVTQSMGLSAYGAGLRGYDEYKTEIGGEIHEGQRQAAGLTMAVVETLTEKMGLDRIAGKLGSRYILDRLVKRNMDGVVKTGVELIEKYAKETGNYFWKEGQYIDAAAHALKVGGKTYLKNAAGETLEENISNVAEWAVDKYITQKEGVDGEDFLKGAAQATLGAVVMSGMLHPISQHSISKATRERRQAAGTVSLTNDDKGNVVELVRDGENVFALSTDGRTIGKATDEMMKTAFNIPANIFESAVEEVNEYGKLQEYNRSVVDVTNEFDSLRTPGNTIELLTDTDGVDYFVSPGQSEDGVYSVVTNDGETKTIAQKDVKSITNIPFQEFVENTAKMRLNAKESAKTSSFDKESLGGLRIDEETTYDGERLVYKGVSEDGLSYNFVDQSGEPRSIKVSEFVEKLGKESTEVYVGKKKVKQISEKGSDVLFLDYRTGDYDAAKQVLGDVKSKYKDKKVSINEVRVDPLDPKSAIAYYNFKIEPKPVKEEQQKPKIEKISIGSREFNATTSDGRTFDFNSKFSDKEKADKFAAKILEQEWAKSGNYSVEVIKETGEGKFSNTAYKVKLTDNAIQEKQQATEASSKVGEELEVSESRQVEEQTPTEQETPKELNESEQQETSDDWTPKGNVPVKKYNQTQRELWRTVTDYLDNGQIAEAKAVVAQHKFWKNSDIERFRQDEASFANREAEAAQKSEENAKSQTANKEATAKQPKKSRKSPEQLELWHKVDAAYRRNDIAEAEKIVSENNFWSESDLKGFEGAKTRAEARILKSEKREAVKAQNEKDRAERAEQKKAFNEARRKAKEDKIYWDIQDSLNRNNIKEARRIFQSNKELFDDEAIEIIENDFLNANQRIAELRKSNPAQDTEVDEVLENEGEPTVSKSNTKKPNQPQASNNSNQPKYQIGSIVTIPNSTSNWEVKSLPDENGYVRLQNQKTMAEKPVKVDKIKQAEGKDSELQNKEANTEDENDKVTKSQKLTLNINHPSGNFTVNVGYSKVGKSHIFRFSSPKKLGDSFGYGFTVEYDGKKFSDLKRKHGNIENFAVALASERINNRAGEQIKAGELNDGDSLFLDDNTQWVITEKDTTTGELTILSLESKKDVEKKIPGDLMVRREVASAKSKVSIAKDIKPEESPQEPKSTPSKPSVEEIQKFEEEERNKPKEVNKPEPKGKEVKNKGNFSEKVESLPEGTVFRVENKRGEIVALGNGKYKSLLTTLETDIEKGTLAEVVRVIEKKKDNSNVKHHETLKNGKSIYKSEINGQQIFLQETKLDGWVQVKNVDGQWVRVEDGHGRVKSFGHSKLAVERKILQESEIARKKELEKNEKAAETARLREERNAKRKEAAQKKKSQEESDSKKEVVTKVDNPLGQSEVLKVSFNGRELHIQMRAVNGLNTYVVVEKAKAGWTIVKDEFDNALEVGSTKAQAIENVKMELDEDYEPAVVRQRPSDGSSVADVEENFKSLSRRAVSLVRRTGSAITVVRSKTDLPKRIQDSLKGDSKGVYSDSTGRVYLIADQIQDVHDAEKTAFHEAVGHKGIRRFLGNNFKPTLDSIFKGMSKADIAQVKANHQNMYDGIEALHGAAEANRFLAEEYIAEMAESGSSSSLYDKVISYVRGHLRKLSPDMDYSKPEVRRLLERSAKAQREGKGFMLDNPRAKLFSNKMSDYNRIMNDYFGNRDIAIHYANVEADKLQLELKDIYKKMSKEDRERLGIKDWQDLDKAILIYLDVQKNPDKLRTLDHLIKNHEQRRLIKLSQELPSEVMDVADKIRASFDKLGEISMDAGVINTVIDNYVARYWKVKKDNANEYGRTFKQSTRHALHRTYETVLDGFAKGYELRIQGATSSLSNIKKEIATVSENRKLVEQCMRTMVAGGVPLFSKTQRPGYVPVNIRGLHYWDKISNGKRKNPREIALDNNGKTLTLPDGTKLVKTEFYAPKDVAQKLEKQLGHSKLMENAGWRTLVAINSELKHLRLSMSFFHDFAFARSYYYGSALGESLDGTGKKQSVKDLNPFSVAKRFIKMVKTAESETFTLIRNHDPRIELAIKNGMTVGAMQDIDEAFTYGDNYMSRLADKMKVPDRLRNQVETLVHGHTRWMFSRLGVALKTKATLLEFESLKKKYAGKLSEDEIMKIAVDVIQNDFGGLHYERLGISKDAQILMRLAFLAPDWTLSNLRSVTETAFADTKESRQAHLNHLKRVYMRAMFITTLGNLLLAGWDREEEETWLDAVQRRYKQAFQRDGKFNWLKIDVTPIIEYFDKDSSDPLYFSAIGHFGDPVKWASEPLKAISSKKSITLGMAVELLTGRDYRNRSFTTASEFFGLTKPDVYSSSNYKEGIIAGDDKPSLKGKTTKFDLGSGFAISKLPTWAIQQLITAMPVPIANLIAYAQGETDGLRLLMSVTGQHVSKGAGLPSEFNEDFESIKKTLKIASTRQLGISKMYEEAIAHSNLEEQARLKEKLERIDSQLLKDSKSPWVNGAFKHIEKLEKELQILSRQSEAKGLSAEKEKWYKEEVNRRIMEVNKVKEQVVLRYSQYIDFEWNN